MSDVMAEGGRYRVVIGAAPFAEEVLEPVHHAFGAGLVGKTPEHFLGESFAGTVRITQFGLNRRAENDLWDTPEIS